MKNLLIISLLFVALFSFSQDIPTVKVGESNLGLRELDIKVEIVGNYVTTTYDMEFYNPKNRVLEGELSFPLGENQKVNRFALELNGKLREAVVVEKELGRVAFENTIRQKIDPALLEQTKGNNYKARIYPIPAKDTKRIVLSFQEELLPLENKLTYNLPLNFKNKLGKFHFEMIVFNPNGIPMRIPQHHLFKKKTTKYVYNINEIDYLANESLKFNIPFSFEKENSITAKDYFYISKSFKPKTKLKVNPKNILLLWDVSLSMKYRNLKTELELLKKYVKHIDNVAITVRKFSNDLVEDKDFKIENGNSKILLNFLKNSIYDGATAFNKILDTNSNYDECLLFTDGMDNLGGFIKNYKTPIYVINSLSVANHSLLKKITINSGGNYINLKRFSVELANKLLTNQAYRFLGVNHKSNMEIYPNKPVIVNGNFSISGKNYSEGDKIELLFGYGNTISERINITLENDYNDTEQLKNIWAQKKLSSLLVNQEKNKNKIISFSKRYQLISPYTSLIVLDRIQDYVKYGIEPPKELQQEYKRLVEIKKNNIDLASLKKDLLDDYNEVYRWWKQKFPIKKTEKIILDNHNSDNSSSLPINNQNINNNQQNIERAQRINDSNVNPNLRIISGVVSDEMGPVADISVIIKGTNNGTVTDFDGNYSINANTGDTLLFRHVSYSDIDKVVGTNDNINIIMKESADALEEVVVTAMGVQREKKSLGYAVSIVKSESLESNSNISISQVLQGKVAGLNVVTNSNFGPNSTINLRGIGSVPVNNEPLFIVDGIIMDKDNFKSINSEDINSIFTLKDADATALYGSKAINGAIIITTKKGLIKNKEKIEELNAKINDKLIIKSWNPKTPYLKEIHKGKTIEQKYQNYLNIRKEYANQPTFYLDVADYFITKKSKRIALKILSNIAEIDINNYELSRALAYKFEALEKYNYAVFIYKEILKLRPEDIQSYRDLGLAYQQIGEYQKALNLFYKIVNGDLLSKDKDERYEGITEIAFIEMNNLISKYKNKLNLENIDKKFIKKIDLDLRIVIDWNHNDTDIDLWVTDPNSEKCFYKHEKTKIGGRISEDMTEGFGPEEFMLKKAIKGDYNIQAKYYSDSMQKISGPTILKITIFKNYGKNNETKIVKVFKLDKNDEVIDLHTISY